MASTHTLGVSALSNLLGLDQVLHDFVESGRTELATALGFRFFVPLMITGAAEGNENVHGKGMVLANFGIFQARILNIVVQGNPDTERHGPRFSISRAIAR
jgi:hypothetical protein